MTLLAELFDRLENIPPARSPHTNPQRRKHRYPHPTPAPAAEASSEPVRNAWTITRGGEPICRMVGAPCPRTEAQAEARWRWPDADIQES